MDEVTPAILRHDALGDPQLLAALQAHARQVIERGFKTAITLCGIHGVYATRHAVAPHTDGASLGKLARGIVILNEGHRLHSRRLDAAGITEGLPLQVGDLYGHDPYDEHWTTVPEGMETCTLAFYVTEEPPERALSNVLAEMREYLAEELQHAD